MTRRRTIIALLALALAIVILPNPVWATRTTPQEASRETARRSFAAVNDALASGETGGIDEIFAADFFNRTPDRSPATTEPYSTDLAGFKASLADLRASFPDARYRVDDVVADGDRAAVRFTFIGTPDAALFGLPAPAAEPVTFGGIALLRVVDGRISESWYFVDQSAVPAQIAALRETPPTGTPIP